MSDERTRAASKTDGSASGGRRLEQRSQRTPPPPDQHEDAPADALSTARPFRPQHHSRSASITEDILTENEKRKIKEPPKLTDAFSVLDALVSVVELEVVAAGGCDTVVEEGAVGHEVPDADALAAAVVDLHVLHDDAVNGGLVAVAVFLGKGAVVTGSCGSCPTKKKKKKRQAKQKYIHHGSGMVLKKNELDQKAETFYFK